MCLEKKILNEICQTYPNSFYVLKQKALLRRAYVRNSKSFIEEEIKNTLSEGLSKRSLSQKRKKRQEKEKRSQSLCNFQGFSLHLQAVELDTFEKDESIPLEKDKESFIVVKEWPDFQPGRKLRNEGPCVADFKKKLDNLTILKKKKSVQDKTIIEVVVKDLKDQKILQRMMALKVISKIIVLFSL